MIMVFQVAKLMHDNVLDAMDGRFYQVQVKCDTALGAAAAPAPAHGANQQYRLRNAMTRSNGVAPFHVTAEGFMGPFVVPGIHCFPDTSGVIFIFNPYS